ncbi:MAG: recombinase family protein [Acutalibacteraceae bacterium]
MVYRRPAAQLSEGYSLSALPEKAERRLQSSWNGENPCPYRLLSFCRKKDEAIRSANIYGWRESTVEYILDNRQYTGCTVNGNPTVSYKVHKVIENPKRNTRLFPTRRRQSLTRMYG